jgi:hypothetical protein
MVSAVPGDEPEHLGIDTANSLTPCFLLVGLIEVWLE